MIRTKNLLISLVLLFIGAGLVLCLQPVSVGAAPAKDPKVSAGAPKEAPVCSNGGACESFIDQYINPFVRLLTGAFGLFAAISLVVASIQYGSARDDPSAVQKAKTRIANTVLGVVAYIFLLAFLNYIVPGGIL